LISIAENYQHSSVDYESINETLSLLSQRLEVSNERAMAANEAHKLMDVRQYCSARKCQTSPRLLRGTPAKTSNNLVKLNTLVRKLLTNLLCRGDTKSDYELSLHF
jgi:Zn-dependent peptidase ImmA (M78 family)